MENLSRGEASLKMKWKFHLQINFWSVAVFSLVLIFFGFALYIRSLGFFVDDWAQLYSLVVRGTEGIKSYFLFDDRPFAWWPDFLIYKVWGTNPIGWHLTNYMLRWLVGLGIWGTFAQLWPRHKREIFWVVLLFAVYPLFEWQSLGLTFVAHWSCYVLFFLSLYLMILAVKKPKYRLLFILLSLAVNVPNLFTYENFIGVEFIRPFLLWVALEVEQKKKRLKKTLLLWLPFLLLAGFYIFWRVFLLQNVRGLDPTLFQKLAQAPATTLITLVNYILRDIVYSIITIWFPAMNPANIDFSIPYLAFGFLLFILVTGILLTFLYYESKKDLPDNQLDTRFSIEAMVIGFVGVILGCAPAWLTLQYASNPTGFWSDRFALPAMWAASLFIVGFLSLMINGKSIKREWIIVLLLGLAVSNNFTTTNEFKWSTTWQQRFFSQIGWRVPNVESKTTFLGDNELFLRMGIWGTAFEFNLFYPTTQPMPNLDYYFLTLNKYFSKNVSNLKDGIDVSQKYWYAKFEANSLNSLVINWARYSNDCVWVLSSNDRYNPLISENTRLALPASNFSRIIVDGPEIQRDVNLFGKEDRNTWCYYYEKADLARQMEKWDDVVSLYENAQVADLHPANGIELMPFIEAYAHTGKADIAQNLTAQAKSLTPNLRNYMCDNWNRIAKDVQGDAVFDAEYESYSKQDLCWEVK